MTGFNTEKRPNETADELAVQLDQIAERLHPLIMSSDEPSSLRLQSAARRIGEIVQATDRIFGSGYGID